MDAQLLVRFDEPGVAEPGGVGQAHARRDFFPSRIVRQILIRSILVWKNGIRTIGRQRLVQIGSDRSIQVQPALIDQLYHQVCK